jgi:predicted metal-binding membrane protein
MAQSRMRVIEDVVGRGMDGEMDVDGMGLGGMAMSAMAGIMFGGRSWIDLLVGLYLSQGRSIC